MLLSTPARLSSYNYLLTDYEMCFLSLPLCDYLCPCCLGCPVKSVL